MAAIGIFCSIVIFACDSVVVIGTLLMAKVNWPLLDCAGVLESVTVTVYV